MEQNLRNKVVESAKEYFNEINKDKSSKEKKYIPASGKVLDEEDLANLIEASLDMWLTTGRFNDEFEKEFAKFMGIKYALTTNSGSSANLLAVSSLTSHKLGERQLKKGDEVITVAAGFPTTVNPIIQNGLVPVFVDVELETYNIDTNKIEEAISEKTKAIIVAHTLGNPFDLETIQQIAKKYNLWIIEDNCDALGATYNNQKTGTFGDIATFSFYPAHHITMGEGGALITNNPQLYRIIMSYRDWGRDCWCKPGVDNTCKNRFNMQLGNLPFGYDHKYTYSHLGYNLKITDFQAAIGLSQLKKLPQFLEKRKENANYLLQKLDDLQEYLILPKVFENTQSSWFGFLLSVKENSKYSKQKLVKYLEENGIGTRQLFAGNMLRQPMFVENEIELRIGNSNIINSKELNENHYKLLPNTDFIMNNTFWVGVYPALDKKDLDKTSFIMHKYFSN